VSNAYKPLPIEHAKIIREHGSVDNVISFPFLHSVLNIAFSSERYLTFLK